MKKPGVDALFKLDCLAILYLAHIGRLMVIDVDLVPLAKTFARATVEELDFRFEAESLRKVHHTLVGTRIPLLDRTAAAIEANVWQVEVPAVLRSTKNMILMEYKSGVNVSTMLDGDTYSEAERAKLCESLCAAVAKQVFIGGCVNCDSHPGNILIDRRVASVPTRLNTSPPIVQIRKPKESSKRYGCQYWCSYH